MHLKSERLKKLETELQDLEHWLKLGLVPKKDIVKHKEEIVSIQKKIEDEVTRLRFLKESGEVEEYSPPKRAPRAAYQQPQSIPEMTVADEGVTEEEFDQETESFDSGTATGEESASGTEATEEEAPSSVYEEDEDPFSDKNRWKRGVLEDPDVDEW